ncbi:MAG TPA: ATP-binding protein [Polyangia bacterium]|jgi:signal transduction histidine kinase
MRAGPPSRIVACVLVMAAATALGIALQRSGPPITYLTFFPALFACTRIAGRTGGLLAIGLSVPGILWLLPPSGSFLVNHSVATWTTFAIYLASGYVVVSTTARLQDAVRARDRLLAQRDDFLRMVSHDLRSPLGAVLMQADVQLRGARARGEAPVVSGLESIRRNAARMQGMIDELVDTVQLEAGRFQLKPQRLELASWLTEALSHAALETGRIRTEVPADLPPMEVDPARLERVVLNLLSNALKYSPPEAEVVLRAERAGAELLVSVRDHGPGIPPDEIRLLFERFHRASTARQEGLGLCLYIARLIVEAHGGRIWVTSSVGAGSTFQFTLPLAP